MGQQRHQLDHIQIICTSLQTDNHISTSPLSFYRSDALPAAQPTGIHKLPDNECICIVWFWIQFQPDTSSDIWQNPVPARLLKNCTEYIPTLHHFWDTVRHWLKIPNLVLPHLHLLPPLGVKPLEFCQDLWHQKTRFPGLSHGTVCMITRLATLTEEWLVTEEQSMEQSRQKQTRITAHATLA